MAWAALLILLAFLAYRKAMDARSDQGIREVTLVTAAAMTTLALFVVTVH